MKLIIYSVFFLMMASCNKSRTLVQPSFIDSLLNNYSPSAVSEVNQRDLQFWQDRVRMMPDNFVFAAKYSSALAGRFHIYGDIGDLLMADSIMQTIASRFREPGMFLTLANYKMSQHLFADAKKYIDTVVEMKAEKYAAQMMLFDAYFELGDDYHSSNILRQNFSPEDYAYNFRQSKYNHYKGKIDNAISHMMKAVSVANSNDYLKAIAMSNAADLYVHEGELKKAVQLYIQCIRLNTSDFHSLMGLGWIALVHDKNDSLARNIFAFAEKRLKSPDPLLKLAQANELHNTNAAKTYAMEFVAKAGSYSYGNMYNKYLIQVYTSILNDPQKALAIAKKEMGNRATPQTAAWLTWCLYSNHQKEEAYNLYLHSVSGRPLEALELYWMGKIMKGLGKGYNAQQFFKAARKNKYDLSPLMRKDLDENIR